MAQSLIGTAKICQSPSISILILHEPQPSLLFEFVDSYAGIYQFEVAGHADESYPVPTWDVFARVFQPIWPLGKV